MMLVVNVDLFPSVYELPDGLLFPPSLMTTEQTECNVFDPVVVPVFSIE